MTDPRRPVVGITVSIETVRSGAWEFEAADAPLTYVRAVQRAGADAVLLVPDPGDPVASARSVLGRIDGLIVSGGAGDVDPGLYGQARRPESVPDAAGRDAFEARLVHDAADRELPVLGICRGMQLITAAYGGVLHLHLPDAVGHDGHRRLPAGFAEHEVELVPSSLAARAAGATRVMVQSHHHQGVADAGRELAVSGQAVGDRTIEAVEDPRRRFVLGVLWHPEEDEASGVVGALVDATRG